MQNQNSPQYPAYVVPFRFVALGDNASGNHAAGVVLASNVNSGMAPWIADYDTQRGLAWPEGSSAIVDWSTSLPELVLIAKFGNDHAQHVAVCNATVPERDMLGRGLAGTIELAPLLQQYRAMLAGSTIGVHDGGTAFVTYSEGGRRMTPVATVWKRDVLMPELARVMDAHMRQNHGGGAS